VRRKSRRSDRRGNTLLEVVLGTMVLTGTLVPGLRLMRDAMIVSREIESFELVATYAVRELEHQMAVTAGTWTEGVEVGDYSADGHSELRYLALRSQLESAGGITDRLMVVGAIVWYDEDGDDGYDVGEPAQTMVSKVAKLTTY